ncbi:LysE family translocator [Paludibacterium purpuratum]|uniref:Threonine/homoserine/homoserine lactone efflux protein n=1 Tax=Paludibacterium purpuratum TaxID=1144873 RepID=A0A4R7B5I8_9NEIS|nr:LysE family translocator [Paludibacterium purpuratum]TDR79934.1 threonine/homoserine/homoserine lactone efflux protein [Paludibacterium purpuratum]
MNTPLYLLFCATALAAVFTPGPAVMLALQNSTLYGWRRTALSSLGNISGLLVLISASAIGLGALLRTSATLFLLLKLCGAGYLIYLGIKQWRAGGAKARQLAARPDSPPASLSLYREGLLLALSNPKAILFITALFPQFIVRDQPLLPQLILLSLTFMAMSFSALMTYALAGQLVGGNMVNTMQSARFRRATGSLFVAMGAGLLTLKAQ